MALYHYVLFMIVAVKFVAGGDPPKCDCGVFKDPTPQTTKDSPVVSKAPTFNFQCTEKGKQSCSRMCTALAGASREEAPKKLCQLIRNADKPFVPVIYYKACDDEDWTFTGLKSSLKICCKDETHIPCS